MPNNPPFVDIRDTQQHRWIEDLRRIMANDPILQDFIPLLDNAWVFSTNHPISPNIHRRVKSWKDGRSHLVVFRAENTGKFTILSFEVLDWRRNIHSAFLDEVVIEIDLFSYVTEVSGDPYCIHVISHANNGPVRYQNVIGFRGSCVFDATDIQVFDLLERFPGQVENILDQIAFIGEVITSEEPDREVAQ